ncbi:MAG: hypothetical protein RSA92_00670 [Bacteroidaceae bacterium]
MKKIILCGALLASILISCNEDKPLSVQGKLVIGHEVSSFIACGDTTAYWIDDSSNRLDSLYNQVLESNSEPYTEVYAELKVKNKGKSTEGFSADYEGVYEVVEVIKVESMKLNPNCR